MARFLPLNTHSRRRIRTTALLLLGSYVVAHLCFWLLPNVFETWNDQTTDQLFVLRSSWDRFRPAYDDRVVHVDFDEISTQALKSPYLNRTQLTEAVGNLASLEVSAQIHDFIMAAPINKQVDRAFVDAVKKAGNVYFGMAFKSLEKGITKPQPSGHGEAALYLHETQWPVVVEGDPAEMYTGISPRLTLLLLASASRGLGSLSVNLDRDGVLCRVPLLVRYGDGFYPILSFRAVCNYLGVPPEKITIRPGKHIILKDARAPGESFAHNIVIPIDRSGNMVVNYIGAWDRMAHYRFDKILSARDDRDDRDELEILRGLLKGRIVVVSDNSLGSTDTGPVPTDPKFPLSGVHTNVINSILTESFLRELSPWAMFFTEFFLLLTVFALSLSLPSLWFSLGALGVAGAYLGVAGAGFLYADVISNIVRPLLMLTVALISIFIYRYVDEEREKFRSLRQRDFIRNTFGRFMSNQVVDQLLDSPKGLKMSGEVREITI